MIGTLLNERYRLDAEIGRGGMGVVYRGHDTLLGRDIAVKVLSEAVLGTESRARLLREARAVAQLDHPNIVAVYDAGEAAGTPFIVMQLVEGESLHDRRPSSLDDVITVARQMCAALEHAHAHGIVHRDLKPEHVLIARDPLAGTLGTAKLVDFGLARTVASRLTVKGAVLGTVYYLAPEQALGQEIDARADLYALGVILYELTTGRLPFVADDPLAVIAQHLHAPVVPPGTLNPDIPPALDTLVVQLMSKRQEARPASAAEVRQALDALSRPEAAAVTPVLPPTAQEKPVAHNLPAPTTPFIGRQTQLAAVREALTHPGVRLLTLTGPGGTGKTRLALQVAAGLLDAADPPFEDGVFFVELAPIHDPELVPSLIAQALGVRQTGDKPLSECLEDCLHNQHLLLMLDNFEQVVAAAPVVSGLLAAAPGLKVLVTSRALLRVYGEHSHPVPPLALPDPRAWPSLERLMECEAVQLFVQRAGAVKAGFALTPENASTVAQICRRLDGLPLAIELAAARVRLLPPRMLLSQLDDRLRLLTNGPKDSPVRHQTLRGAIDWSYDLLATGEKALFRRLAVFVGGCTLEAVQAVCNPSGDLEVLSGLGALVDQSLLQPSDARGEPRFGMLETIREYALEQLEADREEAERTCRERAAFYLALAEEAASELLTSREQTAWMHRLEAEHDNLRATLQWTLERSNADEFAAETMLRLAGALGYFWYWHGFLHEGRRWLRRALASGRGSDRPRAKALGLVGVFAWQQGDYLEAHARFEEAVSLWRDLGDQAGLAEALHWYGHLALDEGEHTEARTLFQESLELYQALGYAGNSLVLMDDLGFLAYHQGDYAAARARFEESLSLYREQGAKDYVCLTLNRLGELARLRGDCEAATALHEESLELCQEAGVVMEMASVLKNLGHVAQVCGDHLRARALFEESLALQREHGNKQGIAECLAGLAGVLAGPERAARLFGAVDALLEAVGAPFSPADRADLERNVAAVRAQMDEASFTAAWAEGRAAAADASADAWERTIAYALEAPT